MSQTPREYKSWLQNDDCKIPYTTLRRYKKNILNNLNEDLYNSKIDSIKYNFNESKKYIVAEDEIYKILNPATRKPIPL